eukprot:7383569-Prymnesium_polylepis.3
MRKLGLSERAVERASCETGQRRMRKPRSTGRTRPSPSWMLTASPASLPRTPPHPESGGRARRCRWAWATYVPGPATNVT